MHHGVMEDSLTPEDVSYARILLFDAFRAYHRGYRLNDFIDEVYEENQLERYTARGARLLTDYEILNFCSAPLKRFPRTGGAARRSDGGCLVTCVNIRRSCVRSSLSARSPRCACLS